MARRLIVCADVAPQVRIDGVLDERAPLALEELAQARRQQRDDLIGDELVRFEAPRRTLGGSQEQQRKGKHGERQPDTTSVQHDGIVRVLLSRAQAPSHRTRPVPTLPIPTPSPGSRVRRVPVPTASDSLR